MGSVFEALNYSDGDVQKGGLLGVAAADDDDEEEEVSRGRNIRFFDITNREKEIQLS